MTFHILTIFPEIFQNNSYVNYSILKRAQEKKLIRIKAHNLRDYAQDKHNKVDDIPYGGGPGMVLKIEPIAKAIASILKSAHCLLPIAKQKGTRIILFSARGKKLDEKTAKRLTKYNHLILICGRYEGVDERVARHIADEEISIGDYVLSGGELPALILIEAVSRLVKGVLGKRQSLESIKGSYPAYTRPETFKMPAGNKEWRVPNVLLSGNHKKIDEWRKKKAPR